MGRCLLAPRCQGAALQTKGVLASALVRPQYVSAATRALQGGSYAQTKKWKQFEKGPTAHKQDKQSSQVQLLCLTCPGKLYRGA